jgi:hypothetical protein
MRDRLPIKQRVIATVDAPICLQTHVSVRSVRVILRCLDYFEVRHWPEVIFGSFSGSSFSLSQLAGAEFCDEKCLERVGILRGRWYHTNLVAVKVRKNQGLCSAEQMKTGLANRKNKEQRSVHVDCCVTMSDMFTMSETLVEALLL